MASIARAHASSLPVFFLKTTAIAIALFRRYCCCSLLLQFAVAPLLRFAANSANAVAGCRQRTYGRLRPKVIKKKSNFFFQKSLVASVMQQMLLQFGKKRKKGQKKKPW
jgi:hypothetical protein